MIYLLRRFAWWLWTPELGCAYRRCPKPTVGFSIWCREHTDRIVAHENIETWPRKKWRR